MTLPRSAGDVLGRHTAFEIESIDRMYCNVYQPRLQHPKAVAGFIRYHLGCPVISSAVLAPISEAFVTAIKTFARQGRIPVVDFVKGQRKDDVMHEHLAGFTADEGVVFIGRAQEKNGVFRTEKRRNSLGLSYPWIVRATAMVNQWYFYCVDTDFGPFFLKFSSYFPYTAKLCVNGNEYAKRQAVKAGIGFTALDNGFATCENPTAVQAICDQLSAEKIDALLRKWLRILPHPFTDADQDTGYRYDISILQAEFCLTQTLHRPVDGRIFFDQVIRDNLDIGRPDQVSLIFDRRIQRGRQHPTPGRFRTRIITDGVTPSLHIDYKTSKIKQYHKLGRALRTETTINDTRDFAIGKRLHNLPALRQIGFTANRRLLRVQTISHDPTDGATAITTICRPVTTDTGTRVPGLRLTDPRAHALLATLWQFRLQPAGFTNHDLKHHVAALLGHTPDQITTSQSSYDLRRLRVHGLITRIRGTHRYQVTDTGLHHALFLTRLHDRFLRTGLAELSDPDPPTPSPLRTAARAYQHAIDGLSRHAGLAA
ncbi:hypothetical protein DMB66_41695 [Actinoplanes sp. ATCC 53533]|uniref:hypothetical protein n=1 Tax=Actinoplanes sp. ATCC 53533 TaxID=1288362 RepID=UPI000F7AE1F3|nr:hypothetical protein [Actinoplanes sp. ATCC 53533]RSM51481.1 hypothetical protein DMB66_41695 [Actinoplanes sp. ATCC 53533]